MTRRAANPGPADQAATDPPDGPDPGQEGRDRGTADSPTAQARPVSPAAPAQQDDVAALRATLQRATADLDNVRKRYARELDRERHAERNRAASAFLPVLDNLELALTHADADPSTIVQGVRFVLEQAAGALAGLGYARQDQVGVPFDPAQHEVVQVVDDADAAPGTVVEVLRPGYGSGSDQLRPAAVAVARQAG